MKLVLGDALQSNRAYLTTFDRVTYSQVAWTAEDVEGIRQNLERQLKFVILVKGHVVIAASHLLESELAQEVMLPHPRLFSEGIIVPALRSEFQSFEQFLDAKIAEGKESAEYGGAVRRETAQMLDATVALAVPWRIEEASQWFQQRMVSDLRDERSVLRSCLRQAGVISAPRIADEIANIAVLSRGDVYRIGKKSQDKRLWDILSNYADFVYYLSGARAVRSEGVLPQENLMDFSLSDLAGGRTHLSDMDVFFKVFVDLVKTATQTHFPADVLDTLSMEDALDLHHVALDGHFIEKYDLIQRTTKQGLALHDPERLVLLMTELEQYEVGLHRQYQRAIDTELPAHLRGRKRASAGKLLNAVASLLIPYWDAPANAKEIVVSGLEVAGKPTLARAIKRRLQRCVRACKRIADRRDKASRPALLRFVDEIRKRYAERL